MADEPSVRGLHRWCFTESLPAQANAAAMFAPDEMSAPDEPVRGTQRAAAAIAALVALAAALAQAALARGPWYDEFYTQYVSRPDRPWLEALRTSWLPDNHPPFFYMLMRATAWLGPIETHRLVNLAFAALAISGGWAIIRDEPRLRAPAALLVLLLAANRWTMLSGTELRSYFISLCVGALLSLALAGIWLSPLRGGRAKRIVYALTVLVAFNTHIVTTLISGALIAPFFAAAMLSRDKMRLRALFPAPLAAGLVFACIAAIQLPYWSHNTQVFWIPGGLAAARLSMQYAALRTMEANPLILIGSAAGAVLLLRDWILTRRIPSSLALSLLTGTGIALALGVVGAIHLARPFVTEIYLVAGMGALTWTMALTCARLLSALPRRVETLLLALGLAASGIALVGNAGAAAHRNSWLGTGRLIARTVARCPDATVHIDPFWNADVMAMAPADNRRVAPWAYQVVAAQLGFRIAPTTSRYLSGICPNLFWAEHQAGRHLDAASALRHIQQGGFAIRSIALYHIGNGWVASDRPL